MTNGCKTWDSSNFSCLTIFNGWKWCVCIPAAIVRFFFFSFFSISWGKKWSSIFSRAIYYAHLGDEANELLHDDRIEFEIHRSQCIKLSFLTLSVSEYLKRQIPSELWNYILYELCACVFPRNFLCLLLDFRINVKALRLWVKTL